jgi:hypothetical protein
MTRFVCNLILPAALGAVLSLVLVGADKSSNGSDRM